LDALLNKIYEKELLLTYQSGFIISSDICMSRIFYFDILKKWV